MPKQRPLTREESLARHREIALRAGRGELRLPDAIRAIREAEGLTQAAFAERVGLTRMRLLDLEKGRGNPKLETLQRICRPFGLEIGLVPRIRTLSGPE
ncbi:DNA-binding XRE family transcriptional regulator [Gemmobacter caeni]|uniref:Transcriptional regulator n=1 Tax=Gemmobacter caeni TaxID=589035 RepID=A0A2T6B8E2_9RHOB|nr:helix-turn-helix domain-containing protein [Gemmobacter caeni]PTX52337.1 transcriptional regulator [Gemmobacter caeni]TWJ02709.1 DNA-binding XRE family transcriptional regulator [Gemmobacter caeni]